MITFFFDAGFGLKLLLIFALFLIWLFLSNVRKLLLFFDDENNEKEKLPLKIWHYAFFWLIIPMYFLKSVLTFVFYFECFNYFYSKKTIFANFRTTIINWHKKSLFVSLLAVILVPFVLVNEILSTLFISLAWCVEKIIDFLKEIWTQLNLLWSSLGKIYQNLR